MSNLRNWIHEHLFSSWISGLLTVIFGWLLIEFGHSFYGWAWRDAAFGTTSESCADATGACWSVIGDFWNIFLVGLYPEDQRWRPYTALIILGISVAISNIPSFNRRRILYYLWPLSIITILILVKGGGLGLEYVPTRLWGGLLITIGLSATGLAFGIPLGVLLALGRCSENYPVIRLLSTIFIDLVRSVPFVLVLIIGTILLPLFLPSNWDIDLLLRVQIAVVMSAAANSAEIVRGGLAGIGRGQKEAAMALGLGYWHTQCLILLPQALRFMVPVFVSMFIVFLKDTSLVIVVGLFDLLGTATLVSGNPQWTGAKIEAYLFVGTLYFLMCFSISQYSRRLEITRTSI